MSDVLVSGLDFGEGPRWRDGRLWYSDFYRHGVFTTDLDGNEKLVVEVPNQPSGLGWLPDGRLLVVSMTDRRVLRLEDDGELVEHADLSEVATFHANDMLVGPDGTAWVGNFGFDLHAMLSEMELPEAIGTVHGDPGSYAAMVARIAPDGEVTATGQPLLFPNGMVLAGDRLLVAETIAFRIQSFGVGDDGSLGDVRTFAAFAPEDGVAPDGICAGPDGGVLVAPALAPMVVQLDADGEVVARHETSQLTYAVAWDGGDTVFAMTAPDSHPDAVDGQGRGLIELISV